LRKEKAEHEKVEVRRLGEAEERIMRNDSAVLFFCRPIFAGGDSEAFQ
jgi:hypothetical protein